MFKKLVSIVIILISLWNNITSLDLLDEYVWHVEHVNRHISWQEKNQIDSESTTKYQRDFHRSRGKRHIDIKSDKKQLTSDSTKTNDNGDESVNLSILESNQSHVDYKRNSRGVLEDLLDDIEWTHQQILDFRGDVLLKWQVRHQEILFRVEARSRGYVGVGFSPNGGMQNADIVIGWVHDNTGKAFLLDYHGSPTSTGSTPIQDEIDNYTLIRGLQNATHTVLEYRRLLDTCDHHDYVLNSDTVRIIWALNDADPHYGFDLSYHGQRRGTQSVYLLGPPPPISSPSMPQDVIHHWDVTLENFEVQQNTSTIYWCKIFQTPPTIHRVHHIVNYVPMINANHSRLLHRMLLYECEIASDGNLRQEQRWQRYSADLGQACYGPEMPNDWDRCVTPLVVWAIGSRGEQMPKHVGLPLYPGRYYMLEVHFDNPYLHRDVSTFGLRLYHTSTLRENEAGVLVTGVALSTLHVIPPHQPAYKSAGLCSVGCTESAYNKTGINVVSVLLHSHLAGRKIKLRHIRGNRELAPIAQDEHYNFAYQQSRVLATEAKILPGDALITECTYSTRERQRPTLGGYSTLDEMCLAFVLHYPRSQLAGCYSMPPVRYFFRAYSVHEFKDRNMADVEREFVEGGGRNSVAVPTLKTPLFPYHPADEHSMEVNEKAKLAIRNAKDDFINGSESGNIRRTLLDKLVIREPVEFFNKTFIQHLTEMPYDNIVTEKIEEYFYNGLHMTFCKKRDDTLIIKEKVEKFPVFESYQDLNTTKFPCSYRTKSASRKNSSIALNLMLVLIIYLPNIHWIL